MAALQRKVQDLQHSLRQVEADREADTERRICLEDQLRDELVQIRSLHDRLEKSSLRCQELEEQLENKSDALYHAEKRVNDIEGERQMQAKVLHVLSLAPC